MIYIITHKIFNNYFEDSMHYKVLHVGRNSNKLQSYESDDTGDNISFKNENYCELTGLYWIWKNATINDDEITGLVHYRRYFTDFIGDILYTYVGIKPKVISYSVIEKSLAKNDIILPVREKIFRTVYQSYTDVHNNTDLELTREAIKKTVPDYLHTYDHVMNSHAYYYANMMICRKKILDDYSEWLFKVLDEVEKRIDISKYEDDYQKRVFGFLSERLLQVWVTHNCLKIKEFPVFNTESRRINIFQKNISRLKKIIKR